jgi:two-component system LytT family sensor kinase
MLQDYIDRRLLAKNRSVYFKKGKWVFHVICFLAFWTSTYLRMAPESGSKGRPLWADFNPLSALPAILPFFLFFYFYCLYLIPVCFKRRRYRRFWIILALLLVIVPWLDEGCQLFLKHRYPGLIAGSKGAGWSYLFNVYSEFITAFLGFTTALFFMELLEGVRTAKETRINTEELSRTELQLLKTRMNPEFINRSLDDIVALSGAGNAAAPDAVVQFSDVLRYRLYRSSQRFVKLEEELQQLTNLFLLQHTLPPGVVSLEIEGKNENALLTPMLLLNIAEALLTSYRGDDEWSLLLYVLAEEAELQIAIELNSTDHALIREKLKIIQDETERICGTKLNFDIGQTETNYSIRLCLPIQLSSTALS